MDKYQKAIEAGKKELAKRGYAYVSRNTAEQWLYSGHMSQDDYELYMDVWNTACIRLSVMEAAAQNSRERLAAHFNMG